MATTYSVDGQSFGSMDEVESYLSGQGYDSYTIDDRRQGGIGTQSGVSMGEGAGLLGVAGGGGLFGGGLGFTSFGDMFDGGGPGRSGSTFVGGPYRAGLNAVGVRPAGYTERMAAGAAPGPQGQRGFNGYGYTDPKTGQWVSAGRDMIDGGGPGRSGDTFQGGLFSGLLNTIGVRPAGYRDRQEAAERERMQMTPADVRTGLLGGTGGTAAAVERAKEAAGADVLNAAEAAIVGGIPGEIKTEADKIRLAEINANAGYAMPLETPQPYTPYSPAPMLASDVIMPPMPPLTTTSGVGVARGIDPTPADNPIGRGITTSYLGGRLPFTYGSDGGGARIPTRYMETPDQIALRRDLAQDYGYLSQAQIPPRLGMTNAPYMRKNITLPPDQSGSYYRPTWLNERTGVSLLGGR